KPNQNPVIKVPAGLQCEAACAANNQCTENGLCRPSLGILPLLNAIPPHTMFGGETDEAIELCDQFEISVAVSC
ncbi:hypothetical protein, partial [Paraburkholderia domus]|uniref:hypothetical protein n=1 Tax=Paraburkholderia domus TaxID=2793075 RepID=UPI001B8A9D7E